jgi:hypothetical protein
MAKLSKTQRAVLKEMAKGDRLLSVDRGFSGAWLLGGDMPQKVSRTETWEALVSGGYIVEDSSNPFSTYYRLTPAGREVVT